MTRRTKINQPYSSIPVTLDEALESLSSQKDCPPASYLAELSDLSGEALEEFKASWNTIPSHRRHEIIAKLTELADSNVELNFDSVFAIGLKDGEEKVRLHSIAGLWENDDKWLMEALIHLLKKDPSVIVRIASAQALERFCLNAELNDHTSNKKKLEIELLLIFNNPNEDMELRRRALEAVSPLSLPGIHKAIQSAYENLDVRLKTSAIYAMGANCNLCWLPSLSAELGSSNAELRYEAARACGELSEEDAVPYLLPLIQDEDKDVQLAAISSLGKIGGTEARETLMDLVDHSRRLVREAASQALHELELYNNPFSAAGLNLDSVDED